MLLNLSTTREHTVQIQQQPEPRQIYTQKQGMSQADKQRMIQHQIIQVNYF